jgi:hypothetical protein
MSLVHTLPEARSEASRESRDVSIKLFVRAVLLARHNGLMVIEML